MRKKEEGFINTRKKGEGVIIYLCEKKGRRD